MPGIVLVCLRVVWIEGLGIPLYTRKRPPTLPLSVTGLYGDHLTGEEMSSSIYIYLYWVAYANIYMGD